MPPDPETWLQGATEMAGSWWPDWHRWILSFNKEQVAARHPGDGKLTADRGRARQLRQGPAVLRPVPNGTTKHAKPTCGKARAHPPAAAGGSG